MQEFVSPELSEEQWAGVRAHGLDGVRVGATGDWARATEARLKLMIPELALEQRTPLTNNGLREPDSRASSVHVLKAALDRHSAAEQL